MEARSSREAPGPRIATAAAALWLGAAAISRWLLAPRDFRWLDDHASEVGWRVELAFQASRGTWAGRDAALGAGPILQLFSRLGSTASPLDPGRASYGLEALSIASAAAAFAFVVGRTIEGAWPRAAAFALLAALGVWLGPLAIVPALSMAAIVAYLPRGDAAPGPRAALWPAILAFAALGVSPRHAVFTCVAILFAAAQEVVSRRRAGEPAQPALVRLGSFLGATAALHALALLLAPSLLGAGWLSVLSRLAAPSPGLGPWDGPLVPAAGSAVLALSAIGIAVLVTAPGRRDDVAGALLAGTAAFSLSVLSGASREAVYAGTLPCAAALLVFAVRDAMRRPSALAAVSALVAALFLLGWIGRWPHEMERLVPVVSRPPATPGYQSDVARAAAWARAEVRRGALRCLDADPSSRPALWVAGAPKGRADGECPIRLERLSSFGADDATAPDVADRLLAIGRRRRVLRTFGPGLVAVERAAHGGSVRRTRVRARGIGIEVPVDVPGEITVRPEHPIPADRLLAIDYDLRVPAWARLVGAAPEVRIATGSGARRSADRRVPMHPGKGTVVLAPDAQAADFRWILGVPLVEPRTVDRLVFRFDAGGTFAPPVTFTLRALHEIAQTAPDEPVAGGACLESVDLARETKAGRAWGIHSAPQVDDERILLHPNGTGAPLAELYLPVRPCARTCFSAEIHHEADEGAGDGVDFEVDVREREVERSLVKRAMTGGQSYRFQFSLAPWRGRDVLLRLATGPRADARFDWATFRDARIAPCGCAGTALVELASSAQAKNARPEVRSAGLFLHPNGPTDPPAEWIVPVTPCDRSCLSVGARVESPTGGGDGVDFEIDVLDGSERHELHRVHVAPTETAARVHLPLGPWQGRPIRVRFATRPGATANFDWATFLAPELRPCPN